MFRARTVFVVGAGASAELGFPLGEVLLKDIADRVDISYELGRLARGDHVINAALRSRLGASADVTLFNEHLHSAWQIARSSKQGMSIDNVLDALEDPKASLVGKFGIVRSILCAEAKSPVAKWIDHFPSETDVSALHDTWLDQLTRLLTEGRKRSDLPSVFDNVAFVNFNYDRTIEQYLPFSLANYFGVKPQEVREVMSSLTILRPYGKAGALPWESQGDHVAFGDCDAEAVETAAEMILTFTEQVGDQNTLAAVRNVLSRADRVVFLGFGFHRQNLKILECAAPPNVEILSTAFGISKSDAASIETEVESSFELSDNVVLNHDYVRLFPLKCCDFMREIWRTLTSEAGEDPRMEFPKIPPIRVPAFPKLGVG